MLLLVLVFPQIVLVLLLVLALVFPQIVLVLALALVLPPGEASPEPVPTPKA